MTADARAAIDAVWRIESARIIAGVAGVVRDIGLAEELAQDALVAALQQWPVEGIPRNPGAWLMATAKRRAIDAVRRRDRLERKVGELGRQQQSDGSSTAPDAGAGLDDEIGDDLLRLIFTACHPVLSVDARLALTLRLLGGLSTDEIARAYLVTESTVAQRIVRAKRTLRAAQVPFEIPAGTELAPRLGSVLEVVYLIFNEGYAATAGEDWMRPALAEEALRLGRILAELAPREPEVHGLVALMEIQASRTAARIGADGAPILLLEQDRGRWDRLLIGRGLVALERAEALGGALGPYALQAAIAACHARAATADATDWDRIVALYDALAQIAPSPVVDLNRAVAIGIALGPAAGLEAVDALAGEAQLAGYHLLPSVRGDLLERLGRYAEAGCGVRPGGLAHPQRAGAGIVALPVRSGRRPVATVPDMTASVAAAAFRALHVPGRPLLMPNPWDVGSARLLATMGFAALATTSSGYAATLGRLDGGITRDEALGHAEELVAAVGVPVSADLENGFGDDPGEVAATVTAAAATGLAGCSIEDWSGSEFYDRALAVDRIAAAVEAARDSGLVLTARAENYIRGNTDLDDTIARLQAFQEAGADVLFAPGIADLADIRRVVEAVDRPVNVLALPGVPSVVDLAGAGVARVSVGGAFNNVATAAVVHAARELLDSGTYGYLTQAAEGRAAAGEAFRSS